MWLRRDRATAVWQVQGVLQPKHWDKKNEQRGSEMCDSCEGGIQESVTEVGATLRRDWWVWVVYKVAATLAATKWEAQVIEYSYLNKTMQDELKQW